MGKLLFRDVQSEVYRVCRQTFSFGIRFKLLRNKIYLTERHNIYVSSSKASLPHMSEIQILPQHCFHYLRSIKERNFTSYKLENRQNPTVSH